jgi:single stranded DNA-binding protein (ssb)
MNETTMTIVGNVVEDPRRRQTKNGHAVTNFRVASTSRRYDREQERFVDNGTLFITVTCWRGLAENVDKSIRKGQPVVVTGRYYMREYTVEEQVRTAYELEATAVGHDLSRGTTQFTRVFHSPTPAVTVARDENGLPSDDSDRWLDLAGSDADAAAADGTGPNLAAPVADDRELAAVS